MGEAAKMTPAIWILRYYRPGALGGERAFLPSGAPDVFELWQTGPVYAGWTVTALALSGLFMSRSYRSQAKLWAWVTGLYLWLGLGARITFAGNYHWWVPSLYRGAVKLPWLRDVPPILFTALGQLGLAFLAAFGFGALLTRLPPRTLRWSKPVVFILASAALAADLLHNAILRP